MMTKVKIQNANALFAAIFPLFMLELDFKIMINALGHLTNKNTENIGHYYRKKKLKIALTMHVFTVNGINLERY